MAKQTKKKSKSVIENPILLSDEEKRKLIKKENRNRRFKKILTGLMSLFIGLFFLLWIGSIVYDYIQTSNHQNPIFCLSKEERNCESQNNKEKIITCHGLGYKSIIPSKKCINIKAGKTFFGFIWSDDPFLDIK